MTLLCSKSGSLRIIISSVSIPIDNGERRCLSAQKSARHLPVPNIDGRLRSWLHLRKALHLVHCSNGVTHSLKLLFPHDRWRHRLLVVIRYMRADDSSQLYGETIWQVLYRLFILIVLEFLVFVHLFDPSCERKLSHLWFAFETTLNFHLIYFYFLIYLIFDTDVQV